MIIVDTLLNFPKSIWLNIIIFFRSWKELIKPASGMNKYIIIGVEIV